ncbi:hypothetical protein B0T16DRAFT_420364 [Cercophora newfieldiana]|uniref:Cupin type-1 domain-containing protein n=1 Tax=Cercophora newfieldiana TaxID=92897 RepID=A0AA40CJY6_9PEZI|nr:hypothetical protein B0T16DRAFT_420364 [Cercophora newfieldiana]
MRTCKELCCCALLRASFLGGGVSLPRGGGGCKSDLSAAGRVVVCGVAVYRRLPLGDDQEGCRTCPPQLLRLGIMLLGFQIGVCGNSRVVAPSAGIPVLRGGRSSSYPSHRLLVIDWRSHRLAKLFRTLSFQGQMQQQVDIFKMVHLPAPNDYSFPFIIINIKTTIFNFLVRFPLFFLCRSQVSFFCHQDQQQTSTKPIYTSFLLSILHTVIMHSTVVSTLFFAAAAIAAPSVPRGATPPAPVVLEDFLPPVVPVNTRAANKELISNLMLAPTQQERVRLLNQPGDYIFDFNDRTIPGSESEGKGGFTVAANARTFPALIGNGGAMTLGFLGPCGMNTAHVHNRATEFNIVVKGRLVTNFVIENGLDPIANTLSLYQMTVFPQGAIHQEFNPDCEDAVFVAGFNNQDPGVEQVAQAFFNLNPAVVGATLGGVTSLSGQDIESFREHIPLNVAQGIDSCLKKCNIKRNAKRDDFFLSN